MKTPSILVTLTILISIATAGLGFVTGVKVKEEIDARIDAQDKQAQAEQERDQASRDLQDAQAELDTKESELAETFLKLKNATENLRSQTTRANNLENDLDAVTRTKNEYELQLSLWDAVGLSIDTARSLRDDLRAANNKIDALEEERAALARRITVLDNKLKLYELDDYEVKLPNIAGFVTAVDPKHHFIVINVGRNQELLEKGKVSISRDGKLIAKAQVTSVDETKSVANILPTWNVDDIQQGDVVMTALESRKD